MYCRDLGENKYWMQCTLNIGHDVVKYCNPISYKYVVHSPNRKGHHSYEVLQHTPSKTNRCLVVPKAKCVAQGIGTALHIVHSHMFE